MLKFISNYFVEQLTPVVRYLHYLILAFVLIQIVISNFMNIDGGVISQKAVEYTATWMHIGIGLLLLILAIVFIVIELTKHGVLYFYPYLVGDIAQLKSDIKNLARLELPEATPKGLAAIIQGLGLGALFLVALAGASWLLLWSMNSSLASDARDLHKSLTGLIIAYVIGHGGMGILHMFMTYKKQKQVKKAN
ncbi:cytochrome b/b6 domain-containing protein [Oceanisphaera sp.]|uniref:cytochrome b/b6 domain-containing protein n=1 Tax=Oceanisphaera sp. TaxID=1929979 RepID=UPI003A8E820E